MKKKALSLALALVMCLGLTVSAFAEGTVWNNDSIKNWTPGPLKYCVEDYSSGVEVNVSFSNVSTIDGIIYDENGVALPTYPGDLNYVVEVGTTITIRSSTAEPLEISNIQMIQYIPDGAPPDASPWMETTGYYEDWKTDTFTFGPETVGFWLIQAESPNFTAPVVGSLEVVPKSSKPADTQPTTPPAIEVEKIPAKGTAKASTQTVTVDGKKVEFQMYAILDANGNGTNYIKLRDMAHILNGTKAQFSVGYSNQTGITATSGQPYQDTGSEMKTPFSGDRSYSGGGLKVEVNGKSVEMTAISLLDDQGGGYTYFKLRDLGKALGFNVGFSREQGVYIESDKPYIG